MSQIILTVDDEKARFTCDDCEWEGPFEEIEELITDAEQRISPGCVAPAGTCPECTALVYYTDETAPAWSAQGELHALREKLRLLDAYGQAKFGDEWWPGNAQPHLGQEDGSQLEALLET